MRVRLEELSRGELEVLARIRTNVMAHIVAAACSVDPELMNFCGPEKKPFGVALDVAGEKGKGGRARILCSGGQVWAACGADGAAPGSTSHLSARTSLHLVFAGPGACVRVLSGQPGFALPIPTGPGFRRALSFFQLAAKKLAVLLGGEATSAEDKAKLLLTATLSGLAAVSSDPYLERRMDHIPDGVVLVAAGNSRMRVKKTGRTISFPVVDDGTEAGEKADASLSFSSPEAAIAVLTGAKQAVVALGSGEVAIAGLLPLVQGLFAVLDRLSWYLAVEVAKRSRPAAGDAQ